MNNPTYLQKQYTKLIKKLNKAFSTGRFYGYTQYKQQQLLDKFASYTLQMKKLGMVAAVGAAVAMATPASGQIIWQENTGMANLLPNDTMRGADLNFVDLDNDGDFDLVANGDIRPTNGYYYVSKTLYYENTGTAINPIFTSRATIINNDSLRNLSFVDIDGDGDLDCFSSLYDYYSSIKERCVYLENTGTTTSPLFIRRFSSVNPLDTINNFVNTSTVVLKGHSNDLEFTDIDGDGDQDVFIQYRIGTQGGYTYLCLKNTGSTTQPSYTDTLHTGINLSTQALATYARLNFIDMDGDNDMDAFIGGKYFENQGSTGSQLNFQEITAPALNPFSGIISGGTNDASRLSRLVDINDDGYVDVYGYPSSANAVFSLLRDTVTFLENLTPSGINSLVQPKLELELFPNPTKGLINIEEPLTGYLEVFNTLGQVLHTKQLEEEQQINLGNLDKGTYLLRIQTLEGVLEKKVVLQ